ncbi:hypothetical protein GCM10011578_062200 [Streptomyces fuscichromogenes]|uniref:Core-binding (CB) domain-containing protein n=1 Tax=Streptomyces fuscichromogenes TaxID=1324013 RepID=A0A917XHW3_9ACTN|nr:hypothetical protein GCM10011578_062200 [Streptomyces fuscichromogenes]
MEAESLRDYAYDLMGLEDFLARVLDPPTDLLSASEEDLVAFRRWRTQRAPVPVGPATWRRNRAAINGLYDWAVGSGLLRQRSYLRRRNGRDALSWGTAADLDVRHLSRAQWVMLHRVGLGGDLPDGSVDRRSRRAKRLRSMPAAEPAVTTGMRSREFSRLLDMEVPGPSRGGTAVPVTTPSPPCAPSSPRPAANLYAESLHPAPAPHGHPPPSPRPGRVPADSEAEAQEDGERPPLLQALTRGDLRADQPACPG